MKELSAKQVKAFFLVILIAVVLSTLSGCTSCSRSGQRAEEAKEIVAISFEDVQVLLAINKLIRVGDTSLLYGPVMGAGQSDLYKGKVYRYDKGTGRYVKVNY